MKNLNGIIYSCPHSGCGAVLSVAVDPIAVGADIVRDVKKLLGRN